MQLNGSNSFDPEGKPLKYYWKLTTKPQGSKAFLSDITEAISSIIPDTIGIYEVELVVNDGKLNSKVDKIVFRVDYPLSIQDNTLVDTDIKIYPNPSSGIFTISACDMDAIKVYSTDGRIVFQKTNISAETLKIQIRNAGIYYISISQNNIWFFKKMIVK